MRVRGWWSAVIVAALSVGFAAPAQAAETTFDDTCAGVYGHRAAGDLDKTTDPSAGSPVGSGQDVSVTLHWPTAAVAGERLHRVMECLSVDKGEPRLWADRQFKTAEGTLTLSATVPAGLAAGSTVCSQSFLKTQGSFGPVTRWSEKTCYPVGAVGSFHALSRSPSPPSSPENRSTPTTRRSYSPPSPSASPTTSPPSGSGDYQAPWPPWEKAPKVSSSPPLTSTPPTATPTSPTPTTAAPKSAAAPKPAAAPAPRKAAGTQTAAPATRRAAGQPAGTLPRTGAGVVVLTGIAAVALFSGRQLRRASERIADSLPVPAVPVGDDEEPTLVLGRRW